MYSNNSNSVYTGSLNTMKLANLTKLRFTQIALKFPSSNGLIALQHLFVLSQNILLFFNNLNTNIFRLYIDFRASIR